MRKARAYKSGRIRTRCTSHPSALASERQRTRILVALRELLNAVNVCVVDWYTSDLLVSAEDARRLCDARDRAVEVVTSSPWSADPSKRRKTRTCKSNTHQTDVPPTTLGF